MENSQLTSIAYVRFKGVSSSEAIEWVKNTCRELDRGFDKDICLYDSLTEQLYEKEEKQSSLISMFSLLAIFISVVGVFGLVFFETQALRKEIGIRKVYGATVRQILYVFNLNYIKILLIGFIASIPVAWYIVNIWLQNFAYHISVFPWVFLFAFLILLLIIVLTVTIQSWRAANENPVNSIKSE